MSCALTGSLRHAFGCLAGCDEPGAGGRRAADVEALACEQTLLGQLLGGALRYAPTELYEQV